MSETAEAIWDAIVVGAGPAGMAAASRLSGSGLAVLLVDEQAEPGGQIYRGIARMGGRRAADFLGRDYRHGLTLLRRFEASSLVYRPETTLWHVTPRDEVYLSTNGVSSRERFRLLVFATGAMERPMPVPGWTLPGVMTAGAVQILLKSALLRADAPLVLAGTGPLFYLLAHQCVAAGANLAGILDTASGRLVRRALPQLPGALAGEGPAYLLKGLGLKGALRRAPCPVFTGVQDLEIVGETGVEGVRFTARGQRRFIASRLVAIHDGVIPAQNATRLAGCAHDWHGAQSSFRPRTDPWGRSSNENIYVVGDAAGIGGARVAELQGDLAGLAIAHRLGAIDAAERDRLALPLRRAIGRHNSVRPLLDALYPPSPMSLNPAATTLTCRCEEIPAGAIRELAARGYGPNQIKAALRCGMGPCQGRLCGPVVTAIIAEARHARPDEVGYYNIRPPLKPLPLGELAAMHDP